MTQDGPFAHVDRFSLRLSFGPYPDEPPSEVYSLVEAMPPGGFWSDEDVMAALDPVLRPKWHREVPLPFTLDIHKSRFSWGADGAEIQVLLYIAGSATSGVIGSAAYAGVKEVLRRFRRTETPIGERADRDQAEAVSRGEIAVAYQTSEKLTLVRDSWNPDTDAWQFRFRSEDGAEYVAVVEPDALISITRELPGNDFDDR